MTTTLDVLILESHPHAGDDTAARLEAAGHRLRRCHEAGSAAFPCVGLTDAGLCPLAEGVDVAVDVRRAEGGGATSLEDGVGCALRAGIPVVEITDGSAESPFGGWTLRADPDEVAETCAVVAEGRFRPLEAAILERVAPLATANGVDGDRLSCSITRRGRGLRIVLTGPRAPVGLQQAMSVRAFGVVRDATRVPHEQVSLAYETEREPAVVPRP